MAMRSSVARKSVSDGRHRSVSGRYSDVSKMPLNDSLAELQAAFPELRPVKLQRFLNACNGDVVTAKAWLTRHVAWLAALPADLKVEAMPELRKGKLHIHGRDRHGRHMLIWQTSLNDTKTRDLTTTVNSAIWWSLQLEDLVDAAAAARIGTQPTLESGNLAEGAFVVDRTKGVNDVPVLSAVIPILQDNFPEMLGALYVVPANFVIRAAFAALTPLLNAQTRKLINMVASTEAMSAYVEQEQLPKRLMGTDAWTFDPDRDLAPR